MTLQVQVRLGRLAGRGPAGAVLATVPGSSLLAQGHCLPFLSLSLSAAHLTPSPLTPPATLSLTGAARVQGVASAGRPAGQPAGDQTQPSVPVWHAVIALALCRCASVFGTRPSARSCAGVARGASGHAPGAVLRRPTAHRMRTRPRSSPPLELANSLSTAAPLHHTPREHVFIARLPVASLFLAGGGLGFRLSGLAAVQPDRRR